MASVSLTNLSKHYGSAIAVDDISVDIREGEFFSLLGPSGCGKSTTLRMMAGFEETDIGRIEVGGVDVSAMAPENRGIGFVFQNYAIFPHMNVFENIAFGLRLRKIPKGEVDQRVRAALDQVGMKGFENRFQREMSGGQQQRVALARVLVTEPRILLLDEPLSALDKNLREEMKFWIKELQVSLGITTVYVTHDQGEALTMSDRIAVMHAGKIAQIGTPREIYETPKNRFVTEFIGESNTLEARVISVKNGLCQLDVGGFKVSAPACNGLTPDQNVVLALRPERVLIGNETKAKGLNRLKLPLDAMIYQGSLVRYQTRIGNQILVAEMINSHGLANLDSGAIVEIAWRVDNGWIIQD